MTASCLECGAEEPAQVRLLGASGRVLCGDCALTLRWQLIAAHSLAKMAGITLEQLRQAVSDG